MTRTTYLLIFLGVAAVAYWWSETTAPPVAPPGPTSSTAIVHLREPGVDAGRAPQNVHVTPDLAWQQLLGQIAEPIRKNLKVQTAVAATPGQWTASITYSSETPDEAAGTVNSLAQLYAEACRTLWKSQAGQAHREALEAVQRAEGEARTARTQLDALRDRQIRAARELAQRPRPVRKVQPTAVENPEWVDLNRKLNDLRKQRTTLLADRTPIHPAVVEIEARIEQLQQQLAATAPQMATSEPAEASMADLEPPADPEPVLMATPDPAELAEIEQLVERTGRAHEDAVRKERQAWQMGLVEPAVEIQLAQARIQVSTSRSGIPAWLMALVVAMTSVTAFGMISAGASIEPILATVAELQAALPAPVVGVIPSTGPSQNFEVHARRQRWLRRALFSAGLILLIAGVALLLLGQR